MKEYKYKQYIANVLPCIGYGIFSGAVIGAVLFLYKLAANQLETLSRYLYAQARSSVWLILLTFAALALFAVGMAWLHKKVPEVKGGGIPTAEGVLRGTLSFCWWKTLIGAVLGSVVSFFCGLPLGAEGPSVLIGTALGCMCGGVSKNQTAWNRYVMSGGAGAGFAVATGAPLAGILFALEEVHKRFTPMLVLTVSMAVLSATGVNSALCSAFGIDTKMLVVEPMVGFELKHTGYLLLLGLFTAVAVGLFDWSITHIKGLTKRFKKYFTPTVKLVIVFLLTGVLCFFYTDGTYNGHKLIHELTLGDKTLLTLIALLAVRCVMMLFVTDSGATGGIFIPTLAIGAVVGAIAAGLLVKLGMDERLVSSVVLLGACAFIGGVLRSPLTATVLFVELTGQFTDFFFVALVVFTVNSITEILNQTSFYDTMLERLAEEQNKGKQQQIAYFEMKVSRGAFVVGKTIRDVMWPPASVVVSITRENEDKKDMDNDGEKKLLVGDTLLIRARFFDEADIKKTLRGLVGADYEIERKPNEE